MQKQALIYTRECEAAQRVREYLRVKQVGIATLAKVLGLSRSTLNCVTVQMPDVAEEDDGKLFLVPPYA